MESGSRIPAMATTTKESVPSAQDGMPAAQNAGAQAPRKDAVGIEIPVVLYASRYSAAAKGLSKTLPPVREETRTVIVFPQGAVVRLSANVEIGEMVVLTNQHTGADVLCRVGAVKTQPGIQNYVDLEFTQRAPGFWEGSSAAAPSAHIEPPVPEPAVRAAATPPVILTPKPLPSSTSSPVSAPSEFRSPVSTPTPLPVPVAPAVPVPPLGAEPPRPASVRPPAPAVPPVTSAVSGVSAGLRQAKSSPSTFTGDQLDWTKQTPPSSKKGLWAAIAAVVVAGLLAGGFLLNRREQSPSPERGVTDAAPSVPMQFATSKPADEPQAPVAAVSASSAAQAPVPAPTWLPDAPRHDEPKAEKVVQPAPQPAPQSAPPAPRRAAIPVAGLTAPIAKNAAITGSSEPPPVLLTQNSTAADGILRTGELSGVSHVEAPTAFAAAENPPTPPAQPVQPVPPARPAVTSGKVEMPKLISSPEPIYPAAARAQSLEGVVVLDALVDATGKVAEVKALSGPMLLRQAAIDALRKWKYQPGQVDGQPTAVHTNVNIRFALR
jgi:periplasmic protein TonB